MKKRFSLMVVLALLLTAIMATGAHAQGTVTYQVGIQLKNLDSANAANVTITYYNKQGGVAGTVDLTGANAIPAGGSKTYATLQGVNAGFDGSAIISSDRPVAAIANVFGGAVGTGMGASYTALSAGTPEVSIPLVLRGHFNFNTFFNVQNAGAAATTVTVTYNNGSTQTATIAPGAAATFDQATNTALVDPSPTTPAGFVGSAKITSNPATDIVATLLQQGPTTLLSFDAFLSTQASTQPVFPLVNANNFGYVTGIQIQNTGTSATDVTVTYTPSAPPAGAGTTCTEKQTIAPGTSATFADAAFRTSAPAPIVENCANLARFVGSAQVTINSANQPLVAIVNQLNSPANKGASYGAFPSGSSSTATNKVDLPLLMDRNFGYFTGYAIANVGTTSTTVTCTYSNSSNGTPPTTASSTATIAPGAAMTVVNNTTGAPLGNGYVGSATCTASSTTDKIVGIVNELSSSAASDSFLVYEGANQ